VNGIVNVRIHMMPVIESRVRITVVRSNMSIDSPMYVTNKMLSSVVFVFFCSVFELWWIACCFSRDGFRYSFSFVVRFV
jgi:hypothetical protein